MEILGSARIISGPRGCGKTTDLIELSASQGGYIVCRSSMVNEIFNMATSLKLSIPYPISYEKFLAKEFHPRGIKEFYIDDLDAFLSFICPSVPISAVSFTKYII